MIQFGASASFELMTALLSISFVSFVGGAVCRKWPEKVQEFAETIDGSVMFLTPQAHRALIRMCGLTLSFVSLGTLVVASFVA
jgi:hypothetical protein